MSRLTLFRFAYHMAKGGVVSIGSVSAPVVSDHFCRADAYEGAGGRRKPQGNVPRCRLNKVRLPCGTTVSAIQEDL